MSSSPMPTMPKVIRLPTVQAMTGLKRSAIYAHIAKGDFPAQRRLTARASGWIESEVISWIESRPYADEKAPR